jgi:hypothetical protein
VIGLDTPPAVARPADAPAIGRPAAQTRARASARSVLLQPALWVALLAFAMYLPTAARVLKLGPDAVEYLDVGRRLAAGEGYLLGVKAFHVGGTDVLHDGLAERPPLFPFLIAGLFLLGLGPHAVQVANAALAAACCALVVLIGERLFGRRVGALAGLLAAATPLMPERMIWPMTEALTISLSLLATWLVIRAPGGPGPRTAALAGVVVGLAYLARPTSALLVLVLGAGAWLLHRDRAAGRRAAAALALGAAVCAAPITLYSVLVRGTLSYSGQTYLYSVYKDPEVMELGFNGPLPTALEFVSANPGLVAGAIWETLLSYARLLFLEWELLLPLLPAWPLVGLALARRRYDGPALLALAVAAANFLFYGLTWSTFQDRYMLLTLLLLLPFAVDALARLGLDRRRLPGPPALSPLVAVVLAVVAVWSPIHLREWRGEFRYGELPAPVRSDEGLRWTGPPRWVRDGEVVRVAGWVSSRTDRLDVLAHAQPWPFTFFSGRPAVLLPQTLDAARLRRFLVEYRVAYLLLDPRDRERRRYQDWLDGFEAEGVAVTTLGAHRIYDTRPLWR